MANCPQNPCDNKITISLSSGNLTTEIDVSPRYTGGTCTNAPPVCQRPDGTFSAPPNRDNTMPSFANVSHSTPAAWPVPWPGEGSILVQGNQQCSGSSPTDGSSRGVGQGLAALFGGNLGIGQESTMRTYSVPTHGQMTSCSSGGAAERFGGQAAGGTFSVPPGCQGADGTFSVPPDCQGANGTFNLPPGAQGPNRTFNVPPDCQGVNRTFNVPPDCQGADETFNVPPGGQRLNRTFNVPPGGQGVNRTFNVPPDCQGANRTFNLPPGAQGPNRTFNVPPDCQGVNRTFNVPPDCQGADGTFNVPPGGQRLNRTFNVPPGGQGVNRTFNVPPDCQGANRTFDVPPDCQGANRTFNVPPGCQGADGSFNVSSGGQGADGTFNIPPGGQDANRTFGVPSGFPGADGTFTATPNLNTTMPSFANVSHSTTAAWPVPWPDEGSILVQGNQQYSGSSATDENSRGVGQGLAALFGGNLGIGQESTMRTYSVPPRDQSFSTTGTASATKSLRKKPTGCSACADENRKAGVNQQPVMSATQPIPSGGRAMGTFVQDASGSEFASQSLNLTSDSDFPYSSFSEGLTQSSMSSAEVVEMRGRNRLVATELDKIEENEVASLMANLTQFQNNRRNELNSFRNSA